MKKNTKIAGLFLSATLLLTSCEAIQNSNKEQRGTAIGAGSGAVIGGILGNNIGKGGNGALGAVLGGVIGGAIGNRIGHKMDKQAREIQQTLPGAQVERIGEGIKITMNESLVNFDFDSSKLGTSARTNLNKLAKVLNDNPGTNINVYGHTDNTGKSSYNQSLSERRAKAVKNYLIEKGIASSRIFTMGMGETSPVATNDTSAGRAQNRRVEFAITANQEMIEEVQNER